MFNIKTSYTKQGNVIYIPLCIYFISIGKFHDTSSQQMNWLETDDQVTRNISTNSKITIGMLQSG